MLMKNLLLPLILVMLIAITSCKNEDTQGKIVQNEYEEVGIIHNQILDSVLQNLWMTKIELFKKGNKASVKSANTQQITKEYATDISFKTVTRCLKAIAPEVTEEHISLFLPRDIHSLKKSSYESSFTPVQNQYYSKLVSILTKRNTTLDDAISQIYNLEEDILMNVTEEERTPLLSMTAVARHSAKYWNEKFTEWNMVLHGKITNEVVLKESTNLKSGEDDPDILKQVSDFPEGYYPHPTDKSKFIYVTDYGTAIMMECPTGLHFNPNICACDYPDSFDWGELAASDAGGAIGGAVGGAIAGGGAGAIPGAIGGAVGSSLTDAILQLFK